MSDQAIIESVRTSQNPTASEATELALMIQHGDLHHIDGDFIQALNNAAMDGEADFNGCWIEKLRGEGWRAFYFDLIKDQTFYRDAEDPLGALVECLNPPPSAQWHPLPKRNTA